MAPILFYLEGLKESHEAANAATKSSQKGSSGLKKTELAHPRLVNNSNIGDSITNRSITLLWDVKMKELVPHTAQVDYLDPNRPLIIAVPFKLPQELALLARAIIIMYLEAQ